MKNNTLRTIGLVALLALGAAVPARAVPVEFNGHYYDIIRAGGIEWTAADAAANASSYLGLPGHLATVTTAGEDAFIDSLRAGLGFGEVWAGGFQNPITETTPTAGWTWVNGEGAFGYSNWLGGEPNDNYGPGSEQYLGLGLNGAFGWNDEGALSLIYGYVVEYERAGVPEGAAGLAGILAIVGLFAAHRRTKKA
jgi:hypothetical protein